MFLFTIGVFLFTQNTKRSLFYFSISAALAVSMSTDTSVKKKSTPILIFMVLLISFELLKLSTIGVICSILGGSSGFLYRHYSFKFSHNNNLSSSQILAIRFWLLWLILFFIAPIKQISSYMSLYYVLLIITVAFISFILQNWLNQQGIIKAGVKRSTTILAFTPITTIVCQYIFLHQFSLSWIILSIVCLIIIFSKDIVNIKLKEQAK